MKYGIILLILAICFSPRIPLPISVPGRVFEIRLEDIILVGLLFTWLVSLFSKSRSIYRTPLFKYIGIYLVIVASTTVIALLTGVGLSPIRTLFYFLKELEYFLIFFLVANWIRSESELKLAKNSLLFAGVLNAVWVGFQLLLHQNRTIFSFWKAFPSHFSPGLAGVESYGPYLIGEASPFSVGGFFMLVFLLAFSLFLFSKNNKLKLLYGLLGAAFFVSILLSYSRSDIISAMVGIIILLLVQGGMKMRHKIAPILYLFFAVMAILILSVYQASYVYFMGLERFPVMFDRFSPSGIERAINERLSFWHPILQQDFNRIFLGFGKGSLGFLKIFPQEPHNHYLRVLTESGIFGLMAFILLLIAVIFFSKKVFRKSQLLISKVIAGTTFAAAVGLGVVALFQDVFVPVVPNEILWVLVGLTAAAYKIEQSIKG